MDERLKEKLELLGEPTLPDSLTAEELFRRIDCGELVLPEETEVEAEAAPSDNVIPWAKILRRGVPIAACLALVVFIAQGRIWKMGSSGGNFSGNAAAPQAAAAADQSEPMEKYSFDEAETPEPFRSITIEEADQEAETTKGAAADDIAEEEVFDDVAEEDELLRPDTGGYDFRPDTGGDDLRPDTGWDDSDNANPDIGIPSPDEEPPFDFTPLVDEICNQVALQDKALTGLTPFRTYGPVSAMTPDAPRPFHIWCRYQNDAGEVVTCRVIYCSVGQKADGSYSLTLLSFKEWDGKNEDKVYIDWEDLGIPATGRNYTTVYPSDGIVIPLLQEIADQYADGLTAVLRNMDCGNYDGDMPKDVTALFAYQNEAEENVTFRFFRCSGTRTEDGEHHLTVDSVDEWDAE